MIVKAIIGVDGARHIPGRREGLAGDGGSAKISYDEDANLRQLYGGEGRKSAYT